MSVINKRVKDLKLNTFGHLTWKSYNSIKKKAMEQEFSWAGLVLSLSIAFFISVGCAQVLSLTYQAMAVDRQSQEPQQKVYRLEAHNIEFPLA